MHACMHTYMATKTISIDVEAYERLRSARARPDESFSQVIKRAKWDAPPSTAAALLSALATAPVPSKETLDRLDDVQRQDRPPTNHWKP
jgi:hypothetical protein